MINYEADIRSIISDIGTQVIIESGAVITAVYDNPYTALVDGQVEVSGSERILYCSSGDVTSLGIGSALTIGGKSYKVISIESDGTGLTIIRAGER